MKEEFLHYLWKYRLYDPDSLTDENGDRITVISPGEYNRDAGPDFFNSRIKSGNTEWAGNVEIHVNSSEFYQHGHHLDPLYDNVILHIVAVNDRPVFNSRNQELLTVELGYDQSLFERYLELVNDPVVIACQPYLRKSDRFIIDAWLERMAAERLGRKAGRIEEILNKTGNDWEETLYRLISRYFGFRVNTDPFEMLVTALPLKTVRKHSDNRLQVEALLYGTSGMLEEGLFPGAIDDDYYLSLIREFKVLQAKYSITPVGGWLWKFSRLRPANFPTVRISQLAAMLTVPGGLFSRITEASGISEIKKLFEVRASEYWDDHYVFGKPAPRRIKNTGDTASDMLLINAVIPVLFTYGKNRDNDILRSRALELLDSVSPEDNTIIREWLDAGIDGKTALRTQALLHLRLEYCNRRKCLDCQLGAEVIARGNRLRKSEELLLEP